MHNQVGKIKSIAVRNFLTYDELKFSPGEYLNIIIGPNGTGKSSIVAAVILGCGGKPSILSRSKDVSEYVKNGKVKANIEIELFKGNGDTIIFNRSFDKTSKDFFRIDGKKVPYKTYIEVVKEYNIHVDNLCMFLPQDRVQDFTKLDPMEILASTQSSVCSPEINQIFESLKVKRETQKNLSKSHYDIEIQLQDHINRNDQLHSLMENNKLKDKLRQDCETYKKKLAWIEYDKAKSQYDETSQDIKKLNDALNEKKMLLKPLEKRQSQTAGSKKNLQESINKTHTLMIEINKDIDKKMDESFKMESEIGQARQNFRNIVSNVKAHEKEIKDLEFIVNCDKIEYANAKQILEEEGNYEGKMKSFDNNLRSNNAKIEKIVQEMDSINRTLDESVIPEINMCKRKLEVINDTHRQRFNILRTNFEQTYQAYKWLEQNRHQFQSHIYNPIITEITITDKKYAKYVENVIAFRDLQTFLCTDKEDMRKLIQKLRNECNLQVNVGYTEPDENFHFQSDIPIDRYLKSFGIYAYMIDVIEGPTPILNYLCRLYNLHNTALGDDRTYQCPSQIPDNINIFFSTNHRFVVNVSAYSGKKSSSCSEIFPRNILNIGVDQNLVDQEQSRLQQLEEKSEQLKARKIPLQKQVQEIEKLQVEIRNQKNALASKFTTVKTLESKLRKHEAELENLKNNKLSIAEERQKSKNLVDKIVNKLLENNSKIYKDLEKYKDTYVQNALAKKKLQVFDGNGGNVDEQIDKLKYDMNQMLETIRRIDRLCDLNKKKMLDKKEEALKMTDNQAPDDPNFKYKKDFNVIPNELEAVQDMILDMQGRIDCIRGVDPNVLAEYEERKLRIEELQHQQNTEKERTVRLEQELETLHNKWFPEIQKIVDSINVNFSNFFAKMGFVGEVELTRKEERDYNDYGIQIRVQYRDNEKLQALNRHVQSGGERAVAIAVYTLSLQHLTMVPFRCVDEINQGMDPKNERKIFQMLVDITCQQGQSQYFFVSPKLLSNLPYNDLMTVSIVHNGNSIDDSYVFASDLEEEDDDDDDEDDL